MFRSNIIHLSFGSIGIRVKIFGTGKLLQSRSSSAGTRVGHFSPFQNWFIRVALELGSEWGIFDNPKLLHSNPSLAWRVLERSWGYPSPQVLLGAANNIAKTIGARCLDRKYGGFETDAVMWTLSIFFTYNHRSVEIIIRGFSRTWSLLFNWRCLLCSSYSIHLHLVRSVMKTSKTSKRAMKAWRRRRSIEAATLFRV